MRDLPACRLRTSVLVLSLLWEIDIPSEIGRKNLHDSLGDL